jgi:hypothetical protein
MSDSLGPKEMVANIAEVIEKMERIYPCHIDSARFITIIHTCLSVVENSIVYDQDPIEVCRSMIDHYTRELTRLHDVTIESARNVTPKNGENTH